MITRRRRRYAKWKMIIENRGRSGYGQSRGHYEQDEEEL